MQIANCGATISIKMAEALRSISFLPCLAQHSFFVKYAARATAQSTVMGNVRSAVVLLVRLQHL